MTEVKFESPESAALLPDRTQGSGPITPNIPINVPPTEQKLDPAELERARAANEQALRDSRESVWFTKEISFNGQRKKIVTQNYNGPCSFIAICNILILRGDIEILPPERTSVSYDILSQLVGEYLLHASPDVDVSAALSMMPLTQKGMDLNPLFTSATAFRPAGDNGALKLFEQAGIPLVHGWLVDPTSPEYSALARLEDYDSSVNLIVEADTLANGQLVMDETAAGPSSAAGSSSGYNMHVSDNWSFADRKKVEDALAVRNFLDTTGSQLTYHGLFTLASSIQPGSLVALFRNSHLSVLHRRAIPFSSTSPTASSSLSTISPPADDASADPALYSLVTDYVFHNEPSVVWERLEDVDGASSTFVDSEFRRSAPVGGDFAGATVPHHMVEPDTRVYPDVDLADQALARHLQAEEDARAQEMYARRSQQQQQQQQQRRQPQFDRNDPRYAHYLQQQQYIQQQQQQQQQQYAQGPPQGQTQANAGHRPFSKMKRKTSCVIM